MEILYVVIVLHAENKQAFTDELNVLFPFATMEVVAYEGNSLLLLSVNVDEICWTGFNVSVFFLEDKIASFSRKHPYLKIGVVNKIGQTHLCFYDGYIMKNKQIVFEYAELYKGYVPLLKQLLEQNDDRPLPIFDAIFTKEY
ncbi:hypothetical protein [Myroides fluvii]|uniref:hypothetical protein n=1 Tax=Myroides fluvii TaxID=2572594 RepID=UPI00131D2174|nr:hypothetical protein [Myroides fluvii]